MSLPGSVRETLLYPRIRMGLAALAAAAVLLTAAAGWWLTCRGALQAERAEAAILDQRRERLLGDIEQARLIKTREKELTEIRRKLERPADANDIMGGLQALAESCRVRIIEQRSIVGGAGPDAVVRTQMAVEGDYAGIRRYLAEIPVHTPALTVVGSMRMKPGASGRTVSAELELFSYFPQLSKHKG
jgi:hypothetical protein